MATLAQLQSAVTTANQALLALPKTATAAQKSAAAAKLTAAQQAFMTYQQSPAGQKEIAATTAAKNATITAATQKTAQTVAAQQAAAAKAAADKAAQDAAAKAAAAKASTPQLTAAEIAAQNLAAQQAANAAAQAQKAAADKAAQDAAAKAFAEQQAAAAKAAADKAAADKAAADAAAKQYAEQQAAQQAAAVQVQKNQAAANTALQALQANPTQANLDAYNKAASATGVAAVDVSQYKAAVDRQAAIATAQANFALPKGDNATTTTQSTTDPMGNKYTYVPSTTGEGQWFKDVGNGNMQAVDAKGAAQANTPVVPQQAFAQQLNQAQTGVYQQAQQQAQDSAINAFQNSAEQTAFQTALSAYQTEANSKTPDPAKLQKLAGELSTAVQAVQKAQEGNPYTASTVQQEVGQSQQYVQAANNAADLKQQQAALEEQRAAAQAAQLSNEQNAIKSLQNDFGSLSPAQQAILGDISGPVDPASLVSKSQGAYQTALDAYNAGKDGSAADVARLAQNLQDAAYVNRVVTGDLAVAVPAANAASKEALTAYQSAQTTQQSAQADLSKSQEAAASAASMASREPKYNWKEDLLGAALIIAGSYGLSSLAAGDVAATAAEMTANGATQAEVADTLATEYGLDAATADSLAGEVATAAPVAEGTVAETALPGLAEGAVAPEAIATATPVAEGAVAETALPGLAEGAVAPEAIATPIAEGAVTETALPSLAEGGAVAPEVAAAETVAPVAPEAAGAAAVPENTIPVTMSDGTVGAYDPATGVTYGADGSVASTGYTAPEVGQGVQVASTEPTAGLAEATTPARVEVSGVAGTTEAPGAVTGPLSEGQVLASPAQIDAGTAVWNPAANAWEVPAAAAEMSPVVPAVVGGAEAAGAVAPVVAGATEGLTAAQIAGGAGALGLGAAALGAGGGAAAAAPAAAAPVTTAGTGAVAPVGTTTGAVAPTTTTPGTVIGAGAPGTVAPAVPPGTVPVTDVGTSAAGQTPLSPAQTEVIAPGTSSVAPVEAQVVAPTDGLPPVVDATVTPVEGGGLPGSVASGGLSATDLALLYGGYKLAEKILTPPTVEMPGYGPIGPTKWGTAAPVVNPGMNPGYLTAPGAVKPQLAGTGTQANYYWGARPLIQNPSDVAQWNVAPEGMKAWGATQAAGTGTDTMNINSLINKTLGLGAARSAYPGAVASPVTVPNYAATTSVNNLVNTSLNLGQQASGLAPVAPAGFKV